MTRHIWLWLVPCTVAATAECMSMVQRQASTVRRRKPWEVYDYVTANYHKSGVYLSEELHNQVFQMLGAPPNVMGKIEYPCYNQCWNTDAPIIVFTDGFNASWKTSHPRSQPGKQLRVAGSVRDPLQMVTSAYCYHHQGKELPNQLIPTAKLMFLGPEAGTQLTAEHMLQQIEWMASIFANPDNNTLRLEFDELTGSSEGFDRGVRQFVNHFFGTGDEFLTTELRSQILEEVKILDENRNPSAVLSPYNGLNHSSGPECERKAASAVYKMEPSLLRKYQELQQRLGYRVYSPY